MTEQTISYGPYIRNFIMYYIGFLAALVAVDIFTDITLPSSMGLLVVLFAANGPGTKFFEETGRLPEKPEKRKMCLSLLAVVLVLGVIQVGAPLLLASDPEEILPGINTMSPVAMLVIILVSGLLAYAMLLLGFGMGAKNALKAQEKKDADKAI